MSARLLVIGIDALDSIQIEKYRDSLPNITRMGRNGQSIRLNSVTPPDSDTAWATIHTGLNPAEHGIVKYDDPLEKSNRLASGDHDNSALRGRTFWDRASESGKRVCVLLPHMGFPVWPVNGVMVGRSGHDKNPSVYPPDFKTTFDLTRLNVVPGIPGRHKEAYIKANEDLTLSQTEFAEEMLRREDWDLFFIYSSVLDMIQHYFWNMCDATDPSYPGPNPYQNTIRHFYSLHDQMVGRLMELAGEQATTIVLSDHGHGMRPMEIFNVNEFLRRNHWLVLKENLASRQTAGFIDKTKNQLLAIISNWGLGTLASQSIRFMPWARKLYSSPLSMDWNKTQAFATNLSGVKAYTYGGINIRREGIGQDEYETLRGQIINQLLKVQDPAVRKSVIRWVCRREELYSGPYLTRYPDILFELRDGLGAGLTADGNLFGKAPSHQLVPGSHRGDTTVFLTSYHRFTSINNLSLMEIYSLFMEILLNEQKANTI